MELSVASTADDVTRVRVVGEINPGPEDQMKQPLVDLLGPEVFSKRVTLDLTDSDYVSSSGIGWILRSHKKFEEQGGRLQLTSVSRAIDEVFRLMRLHSVLHVV